jgi:hypothetical protein
VCVCIYVHTHIYPKYSGLVPPSIQQLWYREAPVDGRTTMSSESVCQVTRSCVDVGSASVQSGIFWTLPRVCVCVCVCISTCCVYIYIYIYLLIPTCESLSGWYGYWVSTVKIQHFCFHGHDFAVAAVCDVTTGLQLFPWLQWSLVCAWRYRVICSVAMETRSVNIAHGKTPVVTIELFL